MLDLNKYASKTTDAFATIQEDGYYEGRLFGIRISEQAKEFVEEGKEPKEQISFLFDIINSDGNHVHVATKPCTVSFTNKSNLPKLFEKVTKLSSTKDFNKWMFDEKNFGDIFKLNVEVKENNGKYYPTVTSVKSKVQNGRMDISAVTEYDLKVYGQPCIDYQLFEGYELENKNSEGFGDYESTLNKNCNDFD